MRYEDIAVAVLLFFLVSNLAVAGAAAASSPQVVAKIVTGRNPCDVAAGFAVAAGDT